MEGAKLHAIRLLPLQGGKAKDLAQIKIGLTQDALARSQDSRFLYFAAKTAPASQDAEIWRLSLEDGKRVSTGVRLPEINALRMQPDGRRLAFVAGKREGEIWMLENFWPKTAASPSR